MSVHVTTDGGAGRDGAGVTAATGRHVTTAMSMQAVPLNVYGPGISEGVDIEIAQISYQIYLEQKGLLQELNDFQTAKRSFGFPALFARMVVRAEMTWGQIPLLPESFRQWAQRVAEDRDELNGGDGSLIPVRVPPMWLADP